MNRFKQYQQYLSEEDGSGSSNVSGSSADIASTDNKILKKKKLEKIEKEPLTHESTDFNKDGKIDINDLIYLVDGLSTQAIKEIIDLVSSYLIKKYSEPSDIIPADGIYRTHQYEAVIRKVMGDKIILKSGIPGFKIGPDGREVKLTDSDLKQKILLAKDAAKYRKAKPRKNLVTPDEYMEQDLDDLDDIGDKDCEIDDCDDREEYFESSLTPETETEKIIFDKLTALKWKILKKGSYGDAYHAVSTLDGKVLVEYSKADKHFTVYSNDGKTFIRSIKSNI